jgi:hypothetical protein
MDLFAALVALGRRWYLTVILLVLVMGGTYAAAKTTKPDYKAEATVIILGPKTNVNLSGENPYLGAGPAAFGNVLTQAMSQDSTVREVLAEHGTRNFTVGQGASANSPVLNVTATDTSPAVATRTANILISLIGRSAEQVQAGIGAPPKSFMTTNTVASGNEPSKLQGSRTRVVIAVGAMGIVFTFATVLLVDSWLMARKVRRRRGRKGRRGGEEANDAADDDSADGAASGQDIPLARVRP